jgi:hypothetical protein
MNTNTIVSLISVVGFPSIMATLVYIGRKLEILDQLVLSMDAVKTNIRVIADHLTKYDSRFEPKELRAMSPYQLTEGGEQFIRDLDFHSVFARERSAFFDYIHSRDPKTKYDVEQAAIQSILFLSDQPFMKFLKVFLYNTPQRTMADVAPTLGVFVRNAYLEAHPEIAE